MLYHDDCFNIFPNIPAKSIDLVLCDMPYGTTACKWDTIIDLEKMWKMLENSCKQSAVIIFTATQPFTSKLVMSNIKWFKYDWIWKKPKGTGHLNSKKMPLKDKEDILVFYKKNNIYNPQFSLGKPYKNKVSGTKIDNIGSSCYGNYKNIRNLNNDGRRYPKQVLEFPVVERTIHPTQKPVALMEYLIKTYSNQGDTVLDFCMGSGTTGVACKNLNRQFIGIEKEKEYYDIAVKRIGEAMECMKT